MRKVTVLGSIIALLLLMVGCGSQVAPSSPTVTATNTSVATTGLTTTPSPWQTYIDPKYSFRIDLPSSASYISADRSWEYTDSRSHANLLINIDSGFKPDYDFCATGTRILVGSSIVGRQMYIDPQLITPTPGTQRSSLSTIIADFVAEGVYIEVTFQVTPPISQQQFDSDYGGTWQHMLASFQPGAGNFGNAQPCS